VRGMGSYIVNLSVPGVRNQTSRYRDFSIWIHGEIIVGYIVTGHDICHAVERGLCVFIRGS